MREPFLLAAAMAVFGYAARADGITEVLIVTDPCWSAAFTADGMQDLAVIVEDDLTAQAALYATNCGWVDLAQNYTPNHPTMFWDQPELPPAPVPLGATAGY